MKARTAKGRRLQKLFMPAASACLIQMVPDRQKEQEDLLKIYLNMLSCSKVLEDFLNTVKAT